jgi:endonuclease-3
LSQRRPKAARKTLASSASSRPGRTPAKRNGSAKIPGQHPAKAIVRRRVPASALPEHARQVYAGLIALYPDAHCELDYQDAWQLVVATILSAQCTDKRVNMVTPGLFARWPGPAQLASAKQEELEEVIRTTGFFRNKARNLIGMAGAISDLHGGRVPDSMEKLVPLPGIGRKTANVVLGNAMNINEGVVVDTHVQRLSARLGLTSETEPVKTEQDLMKLFPRDQWTMLSHLLIWHGRRVCEARKPRCEQCALATICPSAFRV